MQLPPAGAVHAASAAANEHLLKHHLNNLTHA
jgi:hypothetical protein